MIFALGGQAPAGTPVPITLQLDWKPGIQFAGVLVAQERGWYREASLEVTIRANDFKRPYVDVVAGDSHTVGTSESSALVAARGRGVPIRAVATMFQATPIVLISRKSSGLARLQNLAGKRIGVHRAADVRMLDSVFAAAGVLTPCCQWRKVGFDLTELLAGEVDAVQGYTMDEPVRLAQQGVAVNVLPLADHGWTDYSQVIFASESFFTQNPTAMSKFLSATFRGWRAALADRSGTARMIREKYCPELTQAAAEQSLNLLAPLLTRESSHMGAMRRETWDRIFALARENGTAKPPVRVEDLVDFAFDAMF